MRLLKSLSFSTVVLSALLMPAVGRASEPHSWCVTGKPLNKDGSTDATTNKIIDYVCAASPDCCNSSSGRWSLACVQAAALYNWNVNNNSDYCGRYAWALAPIGPNLGGSQYYPRDYNLFALGNVSGFTDVSGPVAARGNITASGFRLNARESEGIALVANGNINLTSGVIFGDSYCAGLTCQVRNVTFVAPPSLPPAPVPSPKYSSVINFGRASGALMNMSLQVSLYDAIPISKPQGSTTLTFAAPAGTKPDPELNVFSVDAAQLNNTYSYILGVPPGSFVIINVITGGAATFMNAGFSGPNGGPLPTSPSKILWNFAGATQLTLQSVGFPGSILAPNADTTFKWGSFSGTAVVKSALANMEFYPAPYQVPSVGGCLTQDPSWSCSNDTFLDYATGTFCSETPATAPAIAAEAGFLDIPLDNYQAEGESRTSPEHRIWYAFQPATYNSKYQPLAVFFNGGPGSATSSALFSFNTANMTLDPAAQSNGSTIASNPNRWTQFANLLYIDAPATGFSYPLSYKTASGSVVTPDIGIDILRDAGIFLQVITRFLVRHPALLGNRVILVPESYGGTRATLMLIYLYNYSSLVSSNAEYQDNQVFGDLSHYFSVAFGTTQPDPTKQIAKRFGHQVMIEPVVVGSNQTMYELQDEESSPQQACIKSANVPYPCSFMSANMNPPTCDPDACDKKYGWANTQLDIAATNLNHVATLQAALGVDPWTIAWMQASSRTAAYGRNDGAPCGDGTGSSINAFSTQDMQTAFGKLTSATDCYFIVLNDAVGKGYNGATNWEDAGDAVGYYFLENVAANVATLITVAQYDQVVWTPAIPQALKYLATGYQPIENLVSNVVYNDTYSTGIARPGAMSITYKSSPATPVRVTMPTFYLSGHTVTMGGHDIPAGGTPGFSALLADVMQWYAAH